MNKNWKLCDVTKIFDTSV